MLPPVGPKGLQAGGPGYHLVGFSVLTALLSRSLPPVQAAAAAWLYGLLLEALQSFVPYRGAELVDVGVNTVAVILGLVGVEIVRAWSGGYAGTQPGGQRERRCLQTFRRLGGWGRAKRPVAHRWRVWYTGRES